ncbi:MAG TPA: hypothetical protein VF591_05850 [Pyrinomonadaceae bacterium]|jgi:hypothetical protein
MNRADTFNGGARGALFAVALTLLLAPAVARAQHQGHDAHKPPAAGSTPAPSPSPTPTPRPEPTPSPVPARGGSHAGHTTAGGPESKPAEGEGLMVMSEEGMGVRVGSSARNVMSMGAMGSGTSWQPAAGPMNMYHKVAGEWLVMFHFNLTAGVNRRGGPRGVTKAESANWFMPMAYRKLGRGTLQLRGMFSAEPFTFPPGGSPLLFQTGETYKGRPIVDAQHPHDLLMELSAQYTHPLGERATWFTYFGYPGEPALGPVAFMHRLSASENPSATLGHHLQDSTHISFGVLTTGLTYRGLKLEGSVFNGREPDENRYDFDAHRWNSRSARLSFMPNENWAMQISHGFLRSPEAHAPEEDIRRTTASVQYNRAYARGYWANAFVWGRNHVSGHGGARNLNAYTLESTLNFVERNYVYTRLELVDRDELLSEDELEDLGVTGHHASFRVGAYTFGGARELWNTEKLSLAVGSDLTFYSKPAALDALYGRSPVSWKLFFRLRPGKMKAESHATHGTTRAPPHRH